MDGLILKDFVSGPLLNNCYLIFDPTAKNGYLIDSPWESKDVLNFISENQLTIESILLTHGHFDHIRGLNRLEAPFYIHSDDVQLLSNPQLNGSLFFGSAISTIREAKLYQPDKPLFLAGTEIKVIHTPGHTPGSVSLLIGDWLFSGDTLFCDSIGRTDVPLGSAETLLDSINDKLMCLPDRIKVYPGHGPDTTIGRERSNNPFLQNTAL